MDGIDKVLGGGDDGAGLCAEDEGSTASGGAGDTGNGISDLGHIDREAVADDTRLDGGELNHGLAAFCGNRHDAAGVVLQCRIQGQTAAAGERSNHQAVIGNGKSALAVNSERNAATGGDVQAADNLGMAGSLQSGAGSDGQVNAVIQAQQGILQAQSAGGNAGAGETAAFVCVGGVRVVGRHGAGKNPAAVALFGEIVKARETAQRKCGGGGGDGVIQGQRTTGQAGSDAANDAVAQGEGMGRAAGQGNGAGGGDGGAHIQGDGNAVLGNIGVDAGGSGDSGGSASDDGDIAAAVMVEGNAAVAGDDASVGGDAGGGGGGGGAGRNAMLGGRNHPGGDIQRAGTVLNGADAMLADALAGGVGAAGEGGCGAKGRAECLGASARDQFCGYKRGRSVNGGDDVVGGRGGWNTDNGASDTSNFIVRNLQSIHVAGLRFLPIQEKAVAAGAIRDGGKANIAQHPGGGDGRGGVGVADGAGGLDGEVAAVVIAVGEHFGMDAIAVGGIGSVQDGVGGGADAGVSAAGMDGADGGAVGGGDVGVDLNIQAVGGGEIVGGGIDAVAGAMQRPISKHPQRPGAGVGDIHGIIGGAGVGDDAAVDHNGGGAGAGGGGGADAMLVGADAVGGDLQVAGAGVIGIDAAQPNGGGGGTAGEGGCGAKGRAECLGASAGDEFCGYERGRSVDGSDDVGSGGGAWERDTGNTLATASYVVHKNRHTFLPIQEKTVAASARSDGGETDIADGDRGRHRFCAKIAGRGDGKPAGGGSIAVGVGLGENPMPFVIDIMGNEGGIGAHIDAQLATALMQGMDGVPARRSGDVAIGGDGQRRGVVVFVGGVNAVAGGGEAAAGGDSGGASAGMESRDGRAAVGGDVAIQFDEHAAGTGAGGEGEGAAVGDRQAEARRIGNGEVLAVEGGGTHGWVAGDGGAGADENTVSAGAFGAGGQGYAGDAPFIIAGQAGGAAVGQGEIIFDKALGQFAGLEGAGITGAGLHQQDRAGVGGNRAGGAHIDGGGGGGIAGDAAGDKNPVGTIVGEIHIQGQSAAGGEAGDIQPCVGSIVEQRNVAAGRLDQAAEINAAGAGDFEGGAAMQGEIGVGAHLHGGAEQAQCATADMGIAEGFLTRRHAEESPAAGAGLLHAGEAGEVDQRIQGEIIVGLALVGMEGEQGIGAIRENPLVGGETGAGVKGDFVAVAAVQIDGMGVAGVDGAGKGDRDGAGGGEFAHIDALLGTIDIDAGGGNGDIAVAAVPDANALVADGGDLAAGGDFDVGLGGLAVGVGSDGIVGGADHDAAAAGLDFGGLDGEGAVFKQVAGDAVPTGAAGGDFAFGGDADAGAGFAAAAVACKQDGVAGAGGDSGSGNGEPAGAAVGGRNAVAGAGDVAGGGYCHGLCAGGGIGGADAHAGSADVAAEGEVHGTGAGMNGVDAVAVAGGAGGGDVAFKVDTHAGGGGVAGEGESGGVDGSETCGVFRVMVGDAHEHVSNAGQGRGGEGAVADEGGGVGGGETAEIRVGAGEIPIAVVGVAAQDDVVIQGDAAAGGGVGGGARQGEGAGSADGGAAGNSDQQNALALLETGDVAVGKQCDAAGVGAFGNPGPADGSELVGAVTVFCKGHIHGDAAAGGETRNQQMFIGAGGIGMGHVDAAPRRHVQPADDGVEGVVGIGAGEDGASEGKDAGLGIRPQAQIGARGKD